MRMSSTEALGFKPLQKGSAGTWPDGSHCLQEESLQNFVRETCAVLSMVAQAEGVNIQLRRF